MEISGKVKEVHQRKQGVTKRGETWVSQSFVIEIPTNNPKYEKLLMMEIFGDEGRVNANIPYVGQDVVVFFDLDSRAWTKQDGSVTWFTSARAYKVMDIQDYRNATYGYGQQAHSAAPQQVAAPEQIKTNQVHAQQSQQSGGSGFGDPNNPFEMGMSGNELDEMPF